MVPRVSPMPLKEETECEGEMVEMDCLNCPGAELPQVHYVGTQTLVDTGGGDRNRMTGACQNTLQSLNSPFANYPANILNDHELEGAMMQNGLVTVGNNLSVQDRGARAEANDKDDEDDVLGLGDVSRQPLLARSVEEREEGEGEEADRALLEAEEEKETSLSILLQVLLPYLISGFGMVGAGMVLDVVQHSAVFVTVTELFILVPALLGLKGNLEMTLASRLSTQANLGNMDTLREKLKMIFGNMVLIQVQAIVVAFLASMIAMAIKWIPNGGFSLNHALLLCASSIFTASVASFILGSLMVGVVLLSRRMNINPDNVATPIAASLGDLTTLAMLAGVAALLFSAIGSHHWLSPTIIVFFFFLLPVWIILALKNKHTSDIVFSGWLPVVCAMVISLGGGYILESTVTKYHGFAVFQPVINGVGGNLVAVHASRISTYLHRRGSPGQLPASVKKGCANPFTFFFGKGVKARAVRVLLMLVIPGHLIFIYTIYHMGAGHTSITILFDLFYLSAALLQIGDAGLSRVRERGKER
ncbi:solute carrier family 41 member 1-like isoform X2 [Babylonia areolata]|uniref:solute carrier family 41 member 1-like isoform X2 n=1 Tax=Babylonia areolata TaxID=304850 RepID=UPI003FCF73C4